MVRPSLWTCPKPDGHRENLSVCTSFPVSSPIPHHPGNSQLAPQDSSLTVPLPKYSQSYELTEYLEGATFTVYLQHLCTFTHRERFSQFSRSVMSNSLRPMNRSTPGLPVHHQLLEFTQTLAHRVSDAIQPSHPLSPTSPPAPNPSQHQSLFQCVNSSHEVAKVLVFQL